MAYVHHVTTFLQYAELLQPNKCNHNRKSVHIIINGRTDGQYVTVYRLIQEDTDTSWLSQKKENVLILGVYSL